MGALNEEQAVNGRSRIFVLSNKQKEASKLNRLSKKIEKKEKRIRVLAQHVKNTVEEQEKIQLKKKLFEDELKKQSDQIEEEKRENSIDQISSSIEDL